MYFQDLISKLDEFWKDQGCVIAQGQDTEVGAGTFHPMTFLRSLTDKPWRVGFVQTSRRPTDGRYADNPLRMQRYYQYQVIIKPCPKDIQEAFDKRYLLIHPDNIEEILIKHSGIFSDDIVN